MAGSFKIAQFYNNEMGTVEDLTALAVQALSNMAAFHTVVHGLVTGQGLQVISGLRVEAQGTPASNVRLKLGVGVDQINLNLVEVLTDLTVNITSGAENKAGGIWGTGAAADATNPRKTVIGIKATYIDTDPAIRTHYDPVALNTFNATVNTRKQNDYDIVVIHGVAGAAPVEPTLTAGYTKLAVITVPAAANVINEANISRTRPIVRNFAPGQVVQLVGDGATTDTVWEAKSRAGATLFSIKDDGTVSLTTTYDTRYVLASTLAVNSGVATLNAQGKLVQDALTVVGKAPGTAAGTLAFYDVNGRVADSVLLAGRAPGTAAGTVPFYDANGRVADSVLLAGRAPGTAAGTVPFYDANGRVADSVAVGGFLPNTGAIGNTVPVRDVNGKLPGDILGNAATVAGKVPGTGIGNLVYSDASNKLAYSITGDAVTVAGAAPDVLATASKIALRDVAGKLAGDILGNAAGATKWITGRTISVTGDVSGTSAVFDGTANLSFATALSATGVAAGTYQSVTVDVKGRVTAGTNQTTLAGYGITDALASSEAVAAPAPNKLLRLDASSKLPASITGDAATLGGNAPGAYALLAGATFTGTTTIDGGGGILRLLPGGNDHVFIAFHARTAAAGARTAYVGYSGAAVTTFDISSSINGAHINLITAGGGQVQANGSPLIFRGVNNQVVQEVMSFLVPTDTRSWVYTTYDATFTDKPTGIDIKDGAAIVASVAITYNANGDMLTYRVVAGGRTVTWTHSYTGTKPTGVTKTVV